jgi:hemoglobin
MTPHAEIAERDIQEGDLHELLLAFYEQISADTLLARYFEAIDMPSHMPRIVDFWSTLLFHSGRYTGNAFRPHLEMEGLTAEHFAHWLLALDAALDLRFAGEHVEQMKDLARRVALSMQLRLKIAPDPVHQLEIRRNSLPVRDP